MKRGMGLGLVVVAFVCGCSPSGTVSQTGTVSQSTSRTIDNPARQVANQFAEKASAELEKGNPGGYEANMKLAMSAEPKNLSLAIDLGRFYRKNGDGEKALPLYRRAVNPPEKTVTSMQNDPLTLTEWGELELGAGNQDRAREAFSRAVARRKSYDQVYGVPKPNFGQSDSDLEAGAHFIAGEEGLLRAHTDIALEHFKKACDVSPASGELKLMYAYALEQCQPPRYEEALATYRKAAQIARGDALAYAKAKKARLESYWSKHHSWAPLDPKTGKEMAWNDKSKTYEVLAEQR